MTKFDYIRKSFIHAAGVFMYIGAVAWFMFNVKDFFSGPDTVAAPVFMLLLFVISASVTGSLVLGKPISLYLDGLKKEAFTFLFITIGWLAVFLVLVAGILLLV